MTHYSEEFRASVEDRLLPPNNARIADIVKETGVPKDTLYDWRARYRRKSEGTLLSEVRRDAVIYFSIGGNILPSNNIHTFQCSNKRVTAFLL